MNIVALVIGSITLVLVGVALLKVRKVHVATYTLTSELARIRRETDVLFAQLQSLLALERKLNLPEALPAMRGWAGSPDFLLAVANEICVRKPITLLECSSGISTLVAARCMQRNGAGHVFSLEHDPIFALKTRRLLEEYDLGAWATVIDAPLVTDATGTPWYSEKAIPASVGPIEMLIVDGPPASVAPMARAPALYRLQSRMALDYVIFVDDANRADEVEMVWRWQALEPRLRATSLPAEKGLVVLELADEPGESRA